MIGVCDIYTQRLPTNFNLTTFSSHLNCKISNNLLLMYVYLLLITNKYTYIFKTYKGSYYSPFSPTKAIPLILDTCLN